MKLLFSIILSLFSISLFSQNIEYTYSRDIYNQVDNSKTKVFDLSGGKVYYEAISDLLYDKIAGYWIKSVKRDDYYIDQIGTQERELLTQNGVDGITHVGRAIQYDGTKSQYSSTVSNMPSNFKLINNSLTLFFRVKVNSIPSSNSFCMGYYPSTQNGAYSTYITPTTGKLIASLRTSNGASAIYSETSICDGNEHTVFIIINKTGNFELYIDNVLQAGFIDISDFTINDYNGVFYLGGVVNYMGDITKTIRDVRVFPYVLTKADRDNVQIGNFVAGSASWWMMEEGKENNTNKINDVSGTTNLTNYGFDVTSLASGLWPSLLNKFGYYTSEDTVITLPKMTSTYPDSGINDFPLIFKRQAKYNLIIDGDSIRMPDIGELYQATELISVNDWFVGDSAINLSWDSLKYQTGRQYVNSNRLIIIKNNITLTDVEDAILRRYMSISDDIAYYPINVTKGSIEGTTAEIYEGVQSLIEAESYTTKKLVAPVGSDLDPTHKYIAMGWADFFTTDAYYTLPLIAKYNALGFSNTFYHQIKPRSNDPENSVYPTRDEIKTIERVGSWNGDHTLFSHIPLITSCATFDGINTPSNDDLRIARSDGTNELGHIISMTVDASITETVRASWLALDATLGSTAWADLSDEQCAQYRNALSAFSMPSDAQNKQYVLKTLDYLSNKYCGTTGTSVYNDNYTTPFPNTVDSLLPSVNNRILGGIFQGSASTQNHELWERLLVILKAYKREYHSKIKPAYFWSSGGGTGDGLFYRPIDAGTDEGIYLDREHTKLASGASLHTSSITGISRSLLDALRSAGYICTMNTQGDGYGDLHYDGQPRLEAQMIFKKNGLNTFEKVGDGFVIALRPWESTITSGNQTTLLASSDLVKSLYDLDYPNLPFYTTINLINKYTAWGIVPDAIGDSYVTGVGLTSYLMSLEALFQYCRRAGITVISHEEAALMGMNKTMPSGYNYFPNSTFETSVKTILDATNSPTYPDGWSGGTVAADTSLFKNSEGTIFIRQYAIEAGSFVLTFQGKGNAVLKIRKILNKDTYNSLDGSAFTEINSITINSPSDYYEYSDTIIIPDAPLETYSTPTTPAEVSYQNYMKGYGDKICGIQIELTTTGANTVNIKNPTIVKL